MGDFYFFEIRVMPEHQIIEKNEKIAKINISNFVEFER